MARDCLARPGRRQSFTRAETCLPALQNNFYKNNGRKADRHISAHGDGETDRVSAKNVTYKRDRAFMLHFPDRKITTVKPFPFLNNRSNTTSLHTNFVLSRKVSTGQTKESFLQDFSRTVLVVFHRPSQKSCKKHSFRSAFLLALSKSECSLKSSAYDSILLERFCLKISSFSSGDVLTRGKCYVDCKEGRSALPTRRTKRVCVREPYSLPNN